jgi:hypothetical protein
MQTNQTQAQLAYDELNRRTLQVYFAEHKNPFYDPKLAPTTQPGLLAAVMEAYSRPRSGEPDGKRNPRNR